MQLLPKERTAVMSLMLQLAGQGRGCKTSQGRACFVVTSLLDARLHFKYKSNSDRLSVMKAAFETEMKL